MIFRQESLLKHVCAILCAFALLLDSSGEDVVSENAKLIVQEALKDLNGDAFEYELQRVSDMDLETVQYAASILGNRLDEIRGRNATVATLRLLRRSRRSLSESTRAWVVLQSKSEVSDVRDLASDLLQFQDVVVAEAKRGGDLIVVNEERLLSELTSDLEKEVLDPRVIAQLVGIKQEKTSALIDKTIVVMRKEPGALPVRLNVLRVLERYHGKLSDIQLEYLRKSMKDSDDLIATVARNVNAIVQNDPK